MNKGGFIKVPSHRGFITIPATIFDDERVSLGAKGLYAQLFYSNKEIKSLEDLVDITSSTKDEIDNWFIELNKIGYLTTTKNGGCVMNIKTQGEKTVKRKLDVEAVEEFTDKVIEPPKPMSAYEKLTKMIESYKFDPKVEQLLKEYFTNWLNKVGRYAEGDDLHGYVARSAINTLVSFHMSDDDMITCIKTSIDKQWRKFVDHRKSTSFKPFDKATITSGSYTEEDIAKIRERAAALEAEGLKGTF